MDVCHIFVVFCLCRYASSIERTTFKNVVAVKNTDWNLDASANLSW